MGSIKWLGQSGFEIKSSKKTILIDPFLNDNPKSPITTEDITEVDLVCVTHDHMDHLGDSIEICRETGATFVGIFELGNHAEEQGIENVVGMNMGATIEIDGFSVSMIQAFHSSQKGAPSGYVLDLGETRIYHAGDTSLFGDMELIGDYYEPEIACLPIGGYYTMGPQEAVE
ncbi:MAG: metal-dependent hydrolase, partial [Hadesarchaea archaeon]|nr:metal-dependent hydrolase [Hadesarchaea archaeon]